MCDRSAFRIASRACVIAALPLAVAIFVAGICVAPATAAAADRPRIGLVLSGGGARGAAHIGVLKYLEAHRIPVDVITGTSMGAIVGGLYASGLTAEEIETIAVQMNWEQKLTDNESREHSSLQRRKTMDRFSVTGTPGFADGELKLPFGAIEGQNITLELQRITHHVDDIEDFTRLPVPFKAVATDIVTGETVVLDKGDLGLALRASMGVPGFFAPTLIDGRLLVDGGVSNNLPVDVAREMGAEVLIVVNVTSPMLDEAGLTDVLAITDQLTRILTGENTAAQVALLGPGDIYIEPAMADFSSVAFDEAPEAIGIGERAAVAHGDALLALSDQDWRPAGKPHRVGLPVGSVNLENTSGIDDRALTHLVRSEPGGTVDVRQIEQDVTRIYGLGNFELVNYSLVNRGGATDVNIRAKAKSWGPDYLHFGIDVEGEFEHEARASLLFGYSRQEVNDLGAQWLSVVALGNESAISTHWYQPLDYRRNRVFLADAGYSDEALYEFSGNDRTAVFALRRIYGYAGVAYDYGVNWRLSLGLERESGHSVLMTGPPGSPAEDYEDGALRVGFWYDTRNQLDFPSRGTLVDLHYRAVEEALGADQSYRQWELDVARYYSYGAHNLGFGINAGGIEGAGNVGSIFRLGGYRQLTGLSKDQVRGRYKAIASVMYYRKFGALPALDVVVGSLLEYGGAWDVRDDISSEDALSSLGVFIGADTPIGTLQLGYAATDGGDSTIFTRIGRMF